MAKSYYQRKAVKYLLTFLSLTAIGTGCAIYLIDNFLL